jgi:hypothetical protein
MQKIKRPLIVILSVVLILALQYMIVSVTRKPDNYVELGSLDALLAMKNDAPPGGISVLDFEKQVTKNFLIEEITVVANTNTNIRLKVWRLNGDTYEAVAESKLFSLTKGENTFPVGNILAKRGDFLGLYMNPVEIDRSGTHAAAGRIFAVEDMDSIPKVTPYHDGQTGYAFLASGPEVPRDSKIDNLTIGSLESPLGMKNAAPPGGISVLDLEKPVKTDITINEVKILSNATSDRVRLKIWRLNGNIYQAVAESTLLDITTGINKIHIDSISAKKGDFLGLYMQSNEIDRSQKYTAMGRVYAIGDAKEIQKDTPSRDGQTGYTFSAHGIGIKNN